jgi:hypothetical protein
MAAVVALLSMLLPIDIVGRELPEGPAKLDLQSLEERYVVGWCECCAFAQPP